MNSYPNNIWIQIIVLCSLFVMHNDYAQASAFVYRPPNLGAARNTAGGATRQLKFTSPRNAIQVLAPEHAALTTNSQPRLYWYLRPGTRNTQLFRISFDRKGAPPLLEVRLPAQIKGGIQSLDLAHHRLRLTPGVAYSWQVKLEPLKESNPYRMAPNIMSSGEIRLTTASHELSRASPEQSPYLAASAGIWYDALDGVSQLVDRGGRRVAYWHQQRADLLEQAKLTVAAKYERDMAARR
jgi:hypothetical protein